MNKYKNPKLWKRMGLELLAAIRLLDYAACDDDFRAVTTKTEFSTPLFNISKRIGCFRSDTENRMFQKYDEAETTYFYPANTERYKKLCDLIDNFRADIAKICEEDTQCENS